MMVVLWCCGGGAVVVVLWCCGGVMCNSTSPQMTEPAVLAPTEEFFTMILYNSDPKSRVFLRRCLNPLVIFLSLALLS